MAAVKRNDPKKRPVPTIEKVEKLERRPAAAAAAGATRKRPSKAPTKAPTKRPPSGRRGSERAERETEAPEFIGGPRNEFGTRVARRITCSRCGNVDHVPHAPKDASRALCRACAVQVLNTYEVGTRAKQETKPAVCSLCKKPFTLPIRVELTDEILCPDCLRGFATWTGAIETPWESRQDVVVEQRVGGTLVRRRKP